MNLQPLSARQVNAIPITEYLLREGYTPIKIRSVDHWYLSPFRSEKDPSFKVNTKLNLWFDHGSGEGGTLIDLGIKLHRISYQMFIEKLVNGNYTQLALTFHPTTSPTPAENKLRVSTVTELGDNELINYLGKRGITLRIANQFCKEVQFKINQRTYKGIGFPNQSGGFELRNHWFKGSSSPKDISRIQNASDKLCVTEGFIDFLSLFEIRNESINTLSNNSDFLILNSLSFLKRTESILQSHPHIILFLDNDAAGTKAKELLIGQKIPFVDASVFYSAYKDLNEYLQEQIKPPQEVSSKKRRGQHR